MPLSLSLSLQRERERELYDGLILLLAFLQFNTQKETTKPYVEMCSSYIYIYIYVHISTSNNYTQYCYLMFTTYSHNFKFNNLKCKYYLLYCYYFNFRIAFPIHCINLNYKGGTNPTLEKEHLK